MNDYLTKLEQFNNIKEIGDIINEVKKLRELYNTQQYEAMKQHINNLMIKYPGDTILWNSTHPAQPLTDQQAYINAETFMKSKAISVLAKADPIVALSFDEMNK